MNKVAMVTGAARGIGLATVQRFLAEGWSTVLVDIDGDNQAKACADLGAPDHTLALTCDVSDPDQVKKAVDQAMARFGRIDALVNNAGTAVFKPALETTFEEWSRVLAVNLNGPFICAQACAPIMIANGGGSIVNIASISGNRASLLRIAYGTSKAALMHLTKQQAAELGNHGIRVNGVAPGPVDTAMAKEVHTADIRADYHDTIPLQRYGTEKELANAIYFLCSDEASYINGHILNVDGGFAATGIGLPGYRSAK